MKPLEGTSNLEYHSNRSHLSSSMLKLLLKNTEEFYEKWFNAKQDDEAKEAFLEGSFVHSLILEPHKVVDEYATFGGLRRHGKAWEEFKQENEDKKILTAAQALRCENLVKSYNSMPIAVELIKDGFAEHTMTSKILDVPVKARADYINIDKGYIVDVKTTSMPTDREIFKLTVQEYMYQLSAALYCQIAFDTYGKLFDFYFVVLSKADGLCSVYKASSTTLSEGSSLVLNAVVKYKHCMATGNWSNEHIGTNFSTVNHEVEEV